MLDTAAFSTRFYCGADRLHCVDHLRIWEDLGTVSFGIRGELQYLDTAAFPTRFLPAPSASEGGPKNKPLGKG
jgi:hypothetical protein